MTQKQKSDIDAREIVKGLAGFRHFKKGDLRWQRRCIAEGAAKFPEVYGLLLDEWIGLRDEPWLGVE